MMMKNHTTNKELSKEMKVLGFPQKSEFFHERNFKGVYEIVTKNELEMDIKRNGFLPGDLYCSAYLASELGEWLPNSFDYKFDIGTRSAHLDITRTIEKNVQWYCSYRDLHKNNPTVISPFKSDLYAKTMPDAMAKMLIHLAKEGIIKPKELIDASSN